ncbi:amidase [Nocardia sp. NPDC058379]|uniref:amidase n=1 Tax=unclassified Nocardia TaxID=2637762 RepID=UPI003666B29F
MTELCDLDLTDVLALLASGRIRPIDLVHAVEVRVAQTEHRHHAYAALDFDAAARAAAIQISGPLRGVPIGVKDLFDTVDFPTRAGSSGLSGYVPAVDAVAVAALRASGAIVLGKQHTHEFGFGLTEVPTRNAWDASRFPGGSSAGGAVSVALGTAFAALGTDSGGSVRVPAAMNGVVGYKPTTGLISCTGIVPGASSLEHVGFITRSVADSEVLLRIMVDGQQPSTVQGVGPDRVRVGVIDLDRFTVHPAVARVYRASLADFATAGLDPVHVPVPELVDAIEAFSVLAAAENYAVHRELLAARPHAYSPAVLRALAAGAAVEPSALRDARTARDIVRSAVSKTFRDHGLAAMCTPTVALPAARIDDWRPETDLAAHCTFTAPFNLTGQPAVSVYAGLSDDATPVGIQFVGRPHRDIELLELARRFEQVRARPRPPVAIDQ